MAPVEHSPGPGLTPGLSPSSTWPGCLPSACETCSWWVACAKGSEVWGGVAPQQGELVRAGTACSCFPSALSRQVFVLAITFLVLFLGNFLTTLKVVHTKLQKNRNKAKTP